MKIKATNVFERNWEAFNREDIVYIKNEGSSRCHSKGTNIRMYDGSLKKVEDIVIGDKIANWKGIGYSTVIDLDNGISDMYLIKQNKGQDYIVTNNHILAVRQVTPRYKKTYPTNEKNPYGKGRKAYLVPIEYDKEKIHYFAAEDFSKLSKNEKRKYSGFKNTYLELPKKELTIDPYYLGLWLGDGNSKFPGGISNIDKEIIDYVKELSQLNDWKLSYDNRCTWRLRHKDFNKQTELSKRFYELNLVGNKHIPKDYIYGDYQDRLKLLAGLIDSDGYKTGRNTYAITQKRENIISSIKEILDISGFYTRGINKYLSTMKREDGSVYSCYAYSIEFNHPDFKDLNKHIKVKRKCIDRVTDYKYMFNTKIDSTYIGKGEYYGFTLDSETPLYKLEDGTITHNSSKTFSICQLLIIWALKNPNKIISVIRKHSTTVKNTVMKQDFIPMLKDMSIYSSSNHNKTDATYTFDNGTVIEFYGADDDEKLHGRRRDVAWLNEATELLWDDFKQIAMRTTGKIIIDYNPSAPTSFLYELPEEKTVQIHSTYKDNPFLTKTQIEFIEDLQYTDPVGWQIYGLGLRGIAKENVFPIWERLSVKPDYLKDYIYGIDFGFSHPTALVKVWYSTDKKEAFIEEEIYASNLTSDGLINEMNRLNIDKSALILADYARPEMIASMREAGYKVVEADKSVQAGINSVRRFKITISHNALNIKKENELYKYKKIGDTITDEPIKKYDDLCDAIRYAFRYIDTNLMRGGELPQVFVFDF